MSAPLSPQRLEKLATMVDDEASAFLDRLKKQTPSGGLNARPADNATFLAWFMQMTNVTYPPEPVIAPNGLVVTASPWLLALPYIEGGDKEMRRYEDLRGVDLNWVRQLAGLSPRVRATTAYRQRQQAPMANTMPNNVTPMQRPMPQYGLGRAA